MRDERNTDPRTIDWAERMKESPIPFTLRDGLPVNPDTRHAWPEGQGGLWHWGPGYAADAVVILDSPAWGRYVLLVQRGGDDGTAGAWGFPGGFIDHPELPLTAAVRELREETSLILPEEGWDVLPARQVPDPRAGANAWMITTPCVRRARSDWFPDVVPQEGECLRAAWVPLDGGSAGVFQWVEEIAGAYFFTPHVDMAVEILG